MEIIQIFGILFALFALSRVILQIRNRNMNLDEGIFWIFVWTLVVVVLVFPQTLDYLARVLGVGRGVDAIIYLSIVALFYLIYRMYAKMEHLEREITKVVREIAIKDRYEPKDKNEG
ncbi:DUF2304 domain-containing protein [Methanotorris igneus]|uniref:DUF2304 domain-containing protein n=1 Tax=Methanotorris igneus (strain DSM 5666 / JCM 11834 / Kol 5) TaxID=880724 RepID=F6BAE5_METIK|nr:DUF2304 family protein [Methanotorris igneus]AEF96958.1 Protein of unknown function DUF2304 [Methanotorris igneus Kol 5]